MHQRFQSLLHARFVPTNPRSELAGWPRTGGYAASFLPVV